MPPQPLGFAGDDRAAVQAWLPATVPGNIHADLMRAGQLPNLYTADGIEKAGWVDDFDWWLEREVTLLLQPGERAWLHAEHVDYIATIWLDDQLLGHHEGAFDSALFELTPHLDADGELHVYRVAVRLWGAARWPQPAWGLWERLITPLTRLILPGKASLRPFHPRLRRLRPPVQAGWDFAPALAAIGVWGAVWVEVARAIRIAEVRIGDWDFDDEPGGECARSTLTLCLDAAVAGLVTLHLAWVSDNGQSEGAETHPALALAEGQSEHRLPLCIPAAQRWHPWEQGIPTLYRLTVEARQQGVVCARQTVRFGIRTLQWEGMRLRVNGRPCFVRGVNWVPADILPGTVPRERYRALLGMARERGVNMLRVWGGGGGERREFYETCDEMGLLVWQEFPFACAFLDHFPRDEAFLQQAEQQADALVRALRHHPSLVIWCAGNEFSYHRNRALVDRLGAAVRAADSRPFLPPSPGANDRHNWHVWHGRAPLRHYARETIPFLSEFGLQAPPPLSSLERFLPAHERWPLGAAWVRHHADLEKLRLYAQPAEGGSPDTLATFVAASQAAQARGLQVAIERMRRRKAAGAGGVMVWQWNEPWPSISWALVDFFGAPKPAAEGLRDWYNPILLSLEWEAPRAGKPPDEQGATLWAINDLSTSVGPCEARLLDPEGKTLWSALLTLPPHSARPVEHLTLPHTRTPLRLELWQAGALVAQNECYAVLPGPQRRSWRASLYRTLAEWVMRW